MAATKAEKIGVVIVTGLAVGGQLIANSLGIGYEAGCLLSLLPIVAGAGVLGINHLIKSRQKNSVHPSDLSGAKGTLDTSVPRRKNPHRGHDVM